MHKGKITMRGRIMAGSQAVLSHDETGQAVYAASYPPDLHLSPGILAYCEQVALATGSDVFVIERAVHSKAMAQTFDEAGLGVLACSMTMSITDLRVLKRPKWRPLKMALSCPRAPGNP